jgi:hypothetical protein
MNDDIHALLNGKKDKENGFRGLFAKYISKKPKSYVDLPRTSACDAEAIFVRA